MRRFYWTQKNEKNKKLSHSLSILINSLSGPLLAVDGKDRIVGINRAIKKYIQCPAKEQIGGRFTRRYNGEIIAEMKMEVKRFG